MEGGEQVASRIRDVLQMVRVREAAGQAGAILFGIETIMSFGSYLLLLGAAFGIVITMKAIRHGSVTVSLIGFVVCISCIAGFLHENGFMDGNGL